MPEQPASAPLEPEASALDDPYRLHPGRLASVDPEHVFILSLSGGGYRGLFSARLLARIETELLSSQAIGPRFDLIAGTSVGGIIATALAHGVSANTVFGVLKTQGGHIFPERRFKALRKLLGPARSRDCSASAPPTPWEVATRGLCLLAATAGPRR